MSSDINTDSEETESEAEPENEPQSTTEVAMSPVKSPCPSSPEPCPGPRPLVPEPKVVKSVAKPLYKYKSPLDRSRSPSPVERPIRRSRFPARRRGPSPSADHLRRRQRENRSSHPYARTSPQRSSSRGRSGLRTPDKPQCSYWTPSRPSRMDVTTATEIQRRREQTSRSLSKLRLPADAHRGPSDPPFRTGPVSTRKFIPFPIPSPPDIAPERFSDPMVSRMISEACTNEPPESKQVPFSRLINKFTALQKFFSRTVNKDWWSGVRKETMAMGGLGVLALMLDENLTWGKICISNGVDLEASGGDVLLSCSTILLRQFCFKIKQMLPCIAPDDSSQAWARQFCYLVCSGHKLLDAAALVEAVVPNSPLTSVLALAITIPSLMLPEHESPENPKVFIQALEYYKPGMVRELVRKTLETHHERCHSKYCTSMTRANVGPLYPTKGIFFVPVD